MAEQTRMAVVSETLEMLENMAASDLRSAEGYMAVIIKVWLDSDKELSEATERLDALKEGERGYKAAAKRVNQARPREQFEHQQMKRAIDYRDEMESLLYNLHRMLPRVVGELQEEKTAAA
jgi:hypothetical protein